MIIHYYCLYLDFSVGFSFGFLFGSPCLVCSYFNIVFWCEGLDISFLLFLLTIATLFLFFSGLFLSFFDQWGTSGNNNETFSMNGAIMRLDKQSPLSVEYLELICKTPLQLNSTIYGNRLYSRVERNHVLALPCIWFNSEWGFEGTKLVPFKKENNIDFFDGAFTWHWHNKWDEDIEDGSKFQILEEKHNNLFLKQFHNE